MENCLKVGDYCFNYQAIGCPDHPAILFLHGFMGDCYEFDEAIALLTDHFYCLAVDLPGHGKTQVAADDRHYTLPYTAYALIQFLQILKMQPCFLLGYSMGGRIALYLTLHFPDFFLKTVLESSSPGLKTPVERTQRILKDLGLAQELEENFPAFLTKWYRQPLFHSIQASPSFEALLQRRLANDPSQLARSLRHLSTGRQPSLWQKLPQNRIPIGLMVGELDQKFMAINAEMAAVGKRMQSIVIPQCGHNIHCEAVHAFVDQVQNFLNAP
jgi:2-succinyl-6-hydroxy-2,4-cyclohexadiene-1-carboxylate synthase